MDETTMILKDIENILGKICAISLYNEITIDFESIEILNEKVRNLNKEHCEIEIFEKLKSIKQEYINELDKLSQL